MGGELDRVTWMMLVLKSRKIMGHKIFLHSFGEQLRSGNMRLGGLCMKALRSHVWSCGSKDWVALGTLRCWRSQSHEIAIKKSCIQSVLLAQVRGRQQRCRGRAVTFDIWHWATAFGICPAGFLSWICPVFSHYALILLLWMVIYFLCYCILEIYNLLFDFIGVL